MDLAIQILAVDIDDILKGLAPFAIFIYFIIQAIVNAAKKKPEPPRPAQPGPAPQGRQEELADEIDAFLRRAAQKQAGQQPVEAVLLEPAGEAAGEPVVVAQVLHASDDQQVPSGGGVAAHVEQHIGGSSFDERASHLGEEVGLADEKLESRLHAKFDHQVGELASLPSATTGSELADTSVHLPTSEVGDDVHDAHDLQKDALTIADISPVSPIFEGPEDIRRAIILNEILRRPEVRW